MLMKNKRKYITNNLFIDFDGEEACTREGISKIIPSVRGERVAVSTLYRWHNEGMPYKRFQSGVYIYSVEKVKEWLSHRDKPRCIKILKQ